MGCGLRGEGGKGYGHPYRYGLRLGGCEGGAVVRDGCVGARVAGAGKGMGGDAVQGRAFGSLVGGPGRMSRGMGELRRGWWLVGKVRRVKWLRWKYGGLGGAVRWVDGK